MEDHRPIDPDAHRYDYYEDEIELMDLLKVIWKWKYLILAGTLLCAVGAALISLSMTKVYRIDTVISPGVVKVEQGGNITYISSAQEIKSLIETGALDSRILQRVQVPDPEVLPKSLDFESKIPKGGNELEISYETANTELGVQVLGELNQLLVEKFKNLVTYYREEYDIQIRSKASETSRLDEKIDKAKNEIARVKAENRSEISELEAKISSKQAEIQANEAEKENKISEIQNKISSKGSEIATNEAEKESKISEIENKISSKRSEIATNKAKMAAAIEEKKNSISTIKAQINGKKMQIKNLEDKIEDLKTEVKRISDNTNVLLKERGKFLSQNKNENNILASVMYTNTIQQNIGYLNSLRSDINNVRHQMFLEKTDIGKLENDIKDIHVQIANIKEQTRIDNEKLMSDIQELQTQMTNFEKQTKIDNEKLMSDIQELQAKQGNVEKQTKYQNEILRSDIKDHKSQIESLIEQTKSKTDSLRSEITALKSEKEYIRDQIKNLEFKREYVQNVQILQHPRKSLGPVKPKIRLNTVLAAVVGLFLTVFLSFFIEYISKYKRRETEGETPG